MVNNQISKLTHNSIDVNAKIETVSSGRFNIIRLEAKKNCFDEFQYMQMDSLFDGTADLSIDSVTTKKLSSIEEIHFNSSSLGFYDPTGTLQYSMNTFGDFVAKNNIEAGKDLRAGDDIYSTDDVFANDYIEAGGIIKAKKDLMADDDIFAGNFIEAGQTITAKWNLISHFNVYLVGGVFAGYNLYKQCDVDTNDGIFSYSDCTVV